MPGWLTEPVPAAFTKLGHPEQTEMLSEKNERCAQTSGESEREGNPRGKAHCKGLGNLQSSLSFFLKAKGGTPERFNVRLTRPCMSLRKIIWHHRATEVMDSGSDWAATEQNCRGSELGMLGV